jgi:ABC-type nitrate/sulfonate/bicarbonate transport system substrate-binding protein
VNKRLWSRGFIASLAVVPLAVSLSGSSVAGAAGTSFLPPDLKGPAPATVKIGTISGFTLNSLPIWLAFGLGYYDQVAKRFHTAISWDAQPSPPTGEAAFLGGADQFTNAGPGFFGPAVLAGKDQEGIFASSISLGVAMTALTKYKASYGSNITPFTGTWCQVSSSGTSHAAVFLEAALHHLSISQLNVTTIGGDAATLPTLQSGSCQITSAASGSVVTGALSGTTYVVQNLIAPSVTLGLVGEYEPIPLTVSHAFAGQYHKLTQAIVDASLKALLYAEANIKNTQRLYAHLPAEMQNAISLGAFTQTLSYFAQGYTPAFDSGMFTQRGVNDSLLLQESTGVIPVGTALNPSKMYTNKYMFQAYKDLGVKLPTGPTAGVVKVPTALGKPTAEAATAFALLTGAHLPANTGISPLSKIKG